MDMFSGSPCEPFRAWNRLEPRVRQEDFSRVLEAQVRDPLWMLTRQWQFGEFQGEDTGSAVFAKMQLEVSTPGEFIPLQGAAEAFDPARPLETRVEQMVFPEDFRARVQAGRQWLAFVNQYGSQFYAAQPGANFQPGIWQALFMPYFPLPDPELDPQAPETWAQAAEILAARPAHQFLKAASGRGLDGIALLQWIGTRLPVQGWPAGLEQTLSAQDKSWLAAAAAAFQQWHRNLFQTPDSAQNTNWHASHLEYQFACDFPEPDQSTTRLRCREYAQGELDWYDFDVDPDAPRAAAARAPELRTFTVIPTEARFGGMPNARWWEFEDGATDLGNIQADTTDLAKILLVEFALLYGNDWFLVPFKAPAGSLSAIKGIVVTDVFGERTWIQPAGKSSQADWDGWSLFQLSVPPAPGQSGAQADPRLFFPPVVYKGQESEEAETAAFLRDETANLVWAVETRVPDFLGQGQDGHSAGREARTVLEEKFPAGAAEAASAGAALRYRLGGTVPENWIPLLPARKPNDPRGIQLQRGSMPRFLPGRVQPVRPRTSILRPGLNPDNSQSTPYYIYEEEISRAGIKVSGTYQRARWFGGATFTWFGRQKSLGRGEGGSGLKFDTLETSA